MLQNVTTLHRDVFNLKIVKEAALLYLLDDILNSQKQFKNYWK